MGSEMCIRDRINPRAALTYIFRRVKVDACMMGVASVKEAEEDFRAARQVLAGEKRGIRNSDTS